MDPNKQKEQFNIAYVHALAAHAGLNHSIPQVDDDSVDIVLYGKGYKGQIRNPQIQIQLKCTSQDLVSNSTLKFPLSRKNYDDLRGKNLLCPRYLAVLVVPKNKDAWISDSDEGMLLRHVCYWASIRNHPDTTHASVTIDIPLAQRLTTDELIRLMGLASDRVFV